MRKEVIEDILFAILIFLFLDLDQQKNVATKHSQCRKWKTSCMVGYVIVIMNKWMTMEIFLYILYDFQSE